jgi:cobalamin biosynthesis protein CobT
MKERNRFSSQMARVRATRFGTPLHKALIQATEEVTGRDDFVSGTKHTPVAHARQALMCAARLCEVTLEQCALFAGLYDHTSASHAIRKMESDDKLKADAEAIFERAQAMLAKREQKFAEGIDAMVSAIKQTVGASEPPPKIPGPKPKPKNLRPNVEELRRKPWEEDTPRGREIARRRAQYYG